MLIAAHRRTPLQGVLVASPANPTGTMMTPMRYRQFAAAPKARAFASSPTKSITASTTPLRPRRRRVCRDDVVVINSFSKYFCMTGWRVGWMVLPEALVRPVDRLQGNLAISVPTLSQIAAQAAFDGRAEVEAVKHGL